MFDAHRVANGRRNRVETDGPLDGFRLAVGMGDGEGDADQLLVEFRVVGEVAVFHELLAVVAREDETGVVPKSPVGQRRDDAADALVHLPNRGAVERPEVVERLAADFLSEARLGVRSEHLQRADVDPRLLADELRCGNVGRVNVHVVDPQEEGRFGAFDEVDGVFLHVLHPGDVLRPAVVAEEAAKRRCRDLQPRLDGRMGGEVDRP